MAKHLDPYADSEEIEIEELPEPEPFNEEDIFWNHYERREVEGGVELWLSEDVVPGVWMDIHIKPRLVFKGTLRESEIFVQGFLQAVKHL